MSVVIQLQWEVAIIKWRCFSKGIIGKEVTLKQVTFVVLSVICFRSSLIFLFLFLHIFFAFFFYSSSSFSFLLARIKIYDFWLFLIPLTELYSWLHYFRSALHKSVALWYLFLVKKDLTHRSGRKYWTHFRQADKKQHCNMFSEKWVDAPLLEIFKVGLDWPLSNPLYLNMSLLIQQWG